MIIDTSREEQRMLRKKKGLTLVEIIVAMAVFAIVIATLLPAFIFVARLNVVSKAGVDITAIAQQEAEKFYEYSRKYKYSEAIVLPEVVSRYSRSGPDDAPVLIHEDTSKHYRIEVYLWNGIWDGVPAPGMTKIRVKVSIYPASFNTHKALPEQIDSILLFKLPTP
ncbi:MAG: type II secretion system protein [Erysipelotrichales bacterium]|nr:MAG: type II secretion system protein [Erysipelotrichales bacterium]